MSGGGGAERLRVERTGGFGGVTVRASVGLHELSSEEDAALEECFAMPPSEPAGPDRFVYRFRVGGRDVTVQEDRVPPALQPLLSRLAETWR